MANVIHKYVNYILDHSSFNVNVVFSYCNLHIIEVAVHRMRRTEEKENLISMIYLPTLT